MSWFDKIMPSRIKTERRTRSVPEGLWIKCPACDAVLYRAELERNLYVCPKCAHHMRGGARMQEALYSLLQMAKTAAALSRLAQAHLPFISVLTDPTTGGVSASLALLGDLNLAEPRALIGFAGPRVIQQTVRETLPEGFQRSEFLLEHGAIDMILDRREMRDKIAALEALRQRLAHG